MMAASSAPAADKPADSRARVTPPGRRSVRPSWGGIGRKASTASLTPATTPCWCAC